MAFQGVLINKSADQTAANYSAANTKVAWDAEIYDTDAAHDNVTNNTRITVPAAWNGKYGLITCCIETNLVSGGTAQHYVEILKNNGASGSWISAPLFTRSVSGVTGGNGQSSTSYWTTVASGPFLLTTGDFYESVLFMVDTSITVKAHSTFGLYVHANPTDFPMIVLARKASDQIGANYSTAPATIAWDQDVYDTHAIHSVSSNAERLTIPVELNGKYLIVTANVYLANFVSSRAISLAIRKNGSLTYAGLGANAMQNRTSGSEGRIQAMTAAVQVATGDYFDALLWCDSDTSVDIVAAKSSFGLRVVG